jgi:uncharacterized membrane protein YecN with MAPEG domain
MEFLAFSWWIWLIVGVLLMIAAVILHLRTMCKLDNIDFDNFFTSMWPQFTCMILGSVSTLLAVIGAVIAIIQFVMEK